MRRKESRPSNGQQKSGLWMEMPTQANRTRDTYQRTGSLAEGTPLSARRIGELMRKGTVEGSKVEGQWVGTRSAVDRYLGRSGGARSGRGEVGGQGRMR